jgi:glutamine amidotransferase
MNTIAIIDYGAGNIKSVSNALTKLGQNFKVVKSASEYLRFEADFAKFSRVILPGVGAAKFAMAQLEQRGFVKILQNLTIPFLGVCLGMQLLAEYSEEGNVRCLGVVPGRVKKFEIPENSWLKVPQVGWNYVSKMRENPLFDGIDDKSCFYFVNSYFLPVSGGNILAKSCYGNDFSAVIQCRNFYGTQFHPEKSGDLGLKLLNNFCTKC